MKYFKEEDINKLVKDEISKQGFLELNNIKKENFSDIIYDELQEAYYNKSYHDVYLTLYLKAIFEIMNEKFVPLLNKLIVCDWHYMHEDIASYLQDYKSPSSIDCLFETAKTKYEYLSYNDGAALTVKCIYALYDIGTESAIETLKILISTETTIETLEMLFGSSNKIILKETQKRLLFYLGSKLKQMLFYLCSKFKQNKEEI